MKNLDEQKHEVMEELQPVREGVHEEGQARAQGFQQLIRDCNISANAMVVAPIRAMARQLDGPWHIAL